MNIVINDLSKSYGKVQAISEINLTLVPGIHGLLGPNGAGKTTLMRILVTILDADRGGIIWGDALNWTRPRAIKGKVGYLPQRFNMYQYLKVKEALQCVSLFKNIPRLQEESQIQRAMERAHITQYADRKVGQLSGGMLRRLGIAQAILGEPTLLIMDEPTAGLDPIERIHFRKLVRDYVNGERIILISSHIVSDVESLCDQVSVMNLGRLLVSGATSEIKSIAGHYVKEERMNEDAMRRLEKNHWIINFTPEESGYCVRYLTDEKQKNAVNTNLEDSYTYLMRRSQP